MAEHFMFFQGLEIEVSDEEQINLEAVLARRAHILELERQKERTERSSQNLKKI